MQQMNMKTSLSAIFILMLQLEYPVNIVTCVIDEEQKDDGYGFLLHGTTYCSSRLKVQLLNPKMCPLDDSSFQT
jgi:hypothetical protein